MDISDMTITRFDVRSGYCATIKTDNCLSVSTTDWNDTPADAVAMLRNKLKELGITIADSIWTKLAGYAVERYNDNVRKESEFYT